MQETTNDIVADFTFRISNQYMSSHSSTPIVCCGKYLGYNLGQKKNKKLSVSQLSLVF